MDAAAGCKLGDPVSEPVRRSSFPARALSIEAADAARLESGSLSHPQRVLGPHRVGIDGFTGVVVRAFHPDAIAVSLVLTEFDMIPMQPAGLRGLFACFLPEASLPLRYWLRFHFPDGSTWEREDPYRFPRTVGEMDLHLFGAYDPPTAFSLDPPHGGQGLWHPIPKPVALGYLIETIWGHHRANSDRLEEDFVLVIHF